MQEAHNYVAQISRSYCAGNVGVGSLGN